MGSADVQGRIWGARARDWADVQEAVAVPMYEDVLRATGLRAGASVLDVGCGSGIFCAMAARLGATVAGLDAAPELLAIARERVPGGDFRVGEMEALPHPDGAFDLVTGFSSFQFAADPAGALREARRVSRTGTVVIAVFDKPEASQSTAYLGALGRLLPPPPPGAPGPFALSADGALEALAQRAGLTPRAVHTVACPWVYPDAATVLRGLMASGPAIRAIQAKGEDAVRDAVLDALAPFRMPAGGYRLSNSFRYLIAS
jgi:SAM-dependent methyltransferase